MDPPLGPMDTESHGQRSLAGYRRGVTRVGHDFTTKPPLSRNKAINRSRHKDHQTLVLSKSSAWVHAQLCLILCNPMNYSLPGSSIHEIFQARVLEWVAISFLEDPPDPGLKPGCLVSCIGRWVLYRCTTWNSVSITMIKMLRHLIEQVDKHAWTDANFSREICLEDSSPKGALKLSSKPGASKSFQAWWDPTFHMMLISEGIKNTLIITMNTSARHSFLIFTKTSFTSVGSYLCNRMKAYGLFDRFKVRKTPM